MLPQSSHLKALCPVCLISCIVRAYLLAICLPHILHLGNFWKLLFLGSGWNLSMCNFCPLLVLKALWHIKQVMISVETSFKFIVNGSVNMDGWKANSLWPNPAGKGGGGLNKMSEVPRWRCLRLSRSWEDISPLLPFSEIAPEFLLQPSSE